MPRSLNGWDVIVPGRQGQPKLRTIAVPGANRKLTVRAELAPLFAALAADYHRFVNPIDVGVWDEGGYNYRQARNANAFSNHASGTAIDLNWSKEGAQNSSFGAAFFADVKHRLAIARLKRIYGDVLFWGGDWNTFKDYMHWEIRPGTSMLKVQDLITKLGIDNDGVRHNDWRGKPLKKVGA